MIIKNKLLIKDFFKRSDIISLSGFFFFLRYIKPNADIILLERKYKIHFISSISFRSLRDIIYVGDMK